MAKAACFSGVCFLCCVGPLPACTDDGAVSAPAPGGSADPSAEETAADPSPETGDPSTDSTCLSACSTDEGTTNDDGATGGDTATDGGTTVAEDPTMTIPTNDVFSASRDFRNVQGFHGWYYLEASGAEMIYDVNYVGIPSGNGCFWGNGGDFMYICVGGTAHPGLSSDTMRRWVAPFTGTVRIAGPALRFNFATGDDGVVVFIRHGDTVVWNAAIPDASIHDFDLSIEVVQGDAIDFVVNKNGNAYFDTVLFDPTLVYTTPESTTAPPTTEVFAADRDYASVQGGHGWSYLDSSGVSLAYNADANCWLGDEGVLRLCDRGTGHPGPTKATLLRWVAPSTGSILIRGPAYRIAFGAGEDGVSVTVRQGDTVLSTTNIPDAEVHALKIHTNVVQGEAIDFLIDKNGSDAFDSTVFNPRIVYTP